MNSKLEEVKRNSPIEIYNVINPDLKNAKRVLSVIRICWMTCVLVGILFYFFQSLHLAMAMFLSLGIILALVDLLFSWVPDPANFTIIERFEDKIIRKGLGLKQAAIQFQDLGELIEDDKGLWLSKKGLKTNLKFYISDMNRIGEKDIIFIPRTIENYTQLKKLLFSLKSE